MRRWFILAVGVLTLTAAGCRAPSPPVTAHASLHSCNVPWSQVRFVVLIDRSGSMAPHWDTVLQQLGTVVDAVPNDAWLDVEAFDGAVLRPSPILTQQVTAANRSQMAQDVRSIPAPSPGANTDIGRMLDRLADVVTNRPIQVNFAVVITDGKHEPLSSSPYRANGSGKAWAALRLHYSNLQSQTGTFLYPYVIPVGAHGLAAANLIRSIVPQTEYAYTPIAGDQIGIHVTDWLHDIRKDLVRERAEVEVQHVLVTATLESPTQELDFIGRTSARMRIASGAACLTYVLRLRDASVTIPPHDTVLARGELATPFRALLLLPWFNAPLAEIPGSRFYGDVALRPTVEFQPTAELAAFGVLVAPRTVEVPVHGTVHRGAMPWSLLAAMLASLVALLLGMNRCFGRIRPGRIRSFGKAPGTLAIGPRVRDGQPVAIGGTAPPGTTAIFSRKPRFWKGTATRLGISCQDGNAAVYTERDDGLFRPERVDGDWLGEQRAYVCWRLPGQSWQPRLSEMQIESSYTGFEWSPAKNG